MAAYVTCLTNNLTTDGRSHQTRHYLRFLPTAAAPVAICSSLFNSPHYIRNPLPSLPACYFHANHLLPSDTPNTCDAPSSRLPPLLAPPPSPASICCTATRLPLGPITYSVLSTFLVSASCVMRLCVLQRRGQRGWRRERRVPPVGLSVSSPRRHERPRCFDSPFSAYCSRQLPFHTQRPGRRPRTARSTRSEVRSARWRCAPGASLGASSDVSSCSRRAAAPCRRCRRRRRRPCRRLQVAHRYVKQRRQFGRHPHFADQGAEVTTHLRASAY